MTRKNTKPQHPPTSSEPTSTEPSRESTSDGSANAFEGTEHTRDDEDSDEDDDDHFLRIRDDRPDEGK